MCPPEAPASTGLERRESGGGAVRRGPPVNGQTEQAEKL